MTVWEFAVKVFNALENGLFVEFLLGVLGIMLLRVAYRLQRTANSIDFTKLILGPDGEVSLLKIMQLVGFIVATWVIIVSTVKGTLTEWLFTSYFTVAMGIPSLQRWAGKDSPPANLLVSASVPPGGSATVDSSAPSVSVTNAPKE